MRTNDDGLNDGAARKGSNSLADAGKSAIEDGALRKKVAVYCYSLKERYLVDTYIHFAVVFVAVKIDNQNNVDDEQPIFTAII